LFIILGVAPVYMRPPYGTLNEKVKRQLFAMGYKIFIWNMDTNDWQHFEKAPHKIFGEYEKQFRRFERVKDAKSWIPLQHDLFRQTMEQQPKIIAYTLKMGYKFVPLNECIKDVSSPYK
jgi:peptidoglycan/xylan/chitin deacetylase (PgdA/CDA1 family)